MAIDTIYKKVTRLADGHGWPADPDTEKVLAVPVSVAEVQAWLEERGYTVIGLDGPNYEAAEAAVRKEAERYRKGWNALSSRELARIVVGAALGGDDA